MKGTIKINRYVLSIILNQALKYPKLECCGYLMGEKIITDTEIIIIVNGVYKIPRYYTEENCNFSTVKLIDAENYATYYNMKIVGNYHSHGAYPAIFSEVDREMQQSFRNNLCTLIYSPFENKLIGDIVTTRGEIIPSRITLFGEKPLLSSYVELDNSKKGISKKF